MRSTEANRVMLDCYYILHTQEEIINNNGAQDMTFAKMAERIKDQHLKIWI
jgi:hypothetical protein